MAILDKLRERAITMMEARKLALAAGKPPFEEEPIDDSQFDLVKRLLSDTFFIEINLNDTFYYAGADGYRMDSYNMEVILPLYGKYGRDALVAYVSLQRGHDPQIPQNVTQNFLAAKKEIEPLLPNIHFDWDIENNED